MANFTPLLMIGIIFMSTVATGANYCRVNGLDEKYNAEKQICCAGKIEPRGMYSKCCEDARAVYDSSQEVCCGGRIEQLPLGAWPGDWGCCDQELYNTHTQTCCMGRLHNLRISYGARKYIMRHGFCCGTEFIKTTGMKTRTACCLSNEGYHLVGRPYRITDQVCCNGHVHSAFGAHRQCCGNEVYNPHLEQCCPIQDGAFRLISNVGYGANICCRNAPEGVIDIGIHVCVNDQPEERECYGDEAPDAVIQCCGGYLRYNMTTHQCCAGKLLSVNETCCRGQLLPEDRVCCGRHIGAVVPSDPSHNACCRDTSYSYQTYDSGVAECVHRRVVQTALCGARRYNPSKKLCCNDRLHRRWSGYTCCGHSIFNPKYMSCCDGKISAASTTCHL